MASPRSMWSGTIRLGLLNVPITLAKAWSDQRVDGLRELCADHLTPVSRNERCDACDGAPASKVRGVETPSGWRKFSENELASIEDATKTDTLDVHDVQPLDTLPMPFATGTYFVRPDKKSKGSELVFAHLCEALDATGYGMIAKWGNSAKQKLVVVYARDGYILLSTIPMPNEIRFPGDQESAHHGVQTDDGQTQMLCDLLSECKNPDGFQYGSYEDAGLRLRNEAIDRILDGNGPTDPIEQIPTAPATDLMDALKASIEQKRKGKVTA